MVTILLNILVIILFYLTFDIKLATKYIDKIFTYIIIGFSCLNVFFYHIFSINSMYARILKGDLNIAQMIIEVSHFQSIFVSLLLIKLNSIILTMLSMLL